MPDNDKPKSVIFRGPVLTQSGYGVHSRQVASWLLKRQETKGDISVSFETLPWGVTPWLVDYKAYDGLIGKIIQNNVGAKKPEEGFDISFQLQLPNEWDPFLAKTNIGMTAAVETDRCNPGWIDAVNRMDLLIVPSGHTKRVLENTGQVKTPIEIVPESWFKECGSSSVTKQNGYLEEQLNLETDFNFLLVSQFTGNNPENDRKNIAYTIKWLLEEFKDDKNVGLIIKTNFGRQTTADKQACVKAITNIMMECRKGAYPRVYLLHGHMSNEDMVGIYTHPKVKALINLSRGECFGLPILEAATCGLPVVVTDWSAHTEFLRQGKYIKIDYNLVPIHETRVDNNLFMKDSRWAFPIEKDVKKKLRRFYESPSIPTDWAKDLKNKLLASHSPENIEAQYDSLFEQTILKK